MYNTTNSIKTGECQPARFTLFRTVVFVVRELYTRDFFGPRSLYARYNFLLRLLIRQKERKTFQIPGKFNWNTLLIENLIGELRWLEEERKSFSKVDFM